MLKNESQYTAITVMSGLIGIVLAGLAIILNKSKEQKVYIDQIEDLLVNSNIVVKKGQVSSTISRLNKSSYMFDKIQSSNQMKIN